jgi:asparagine synthase (glutamine-hydrolysing)
MNAIAAFVHWNDRPVDQTLLQSANACMRHRCPDGAWVWSSGPVGMAQADLATLPEDEPGIPVASGQLRIAASCRIDNREDVLRALPLRFVPGCCTDAALILTAYQAWGESCVDHLIGDFAFIIWDGDRRSILAARDLSGARQLYYYRDRQRLFLASDRTQILQDPTVPLEVDEDQLIEYLTPTYHWYSGWDQGLLRGFHALPAGSILRAQQGNVTVRRFWGWRDRMPSRRSEQQVIEEYFHTLEEAVRCRLRSRGDRVAIEMSGGLDSPAIAGLASRLANSSGPELHTLSLVFDEFPEVDERARIHKVLERYPLSPHFIAADRLYGPQCLRPDWAPHSVTDPNELMVPRAAYCLYETALQAGCQVVLTGYMGDSLNNGCDQVYFDLLRRRRLGEALRRLRIDWSRSRKQAVRNLLLHGLLPQVPLPLLQASLAIQERRKGMPSELPEFISAHVRRRIHEVDEAVRLRQLQQLHIRCPAVRDTLDGLVPPMLAVTRAYPLPLERRHPYTDRRLVELVLAMPQEMKWEHEQDDYFLSTRLHHRRAMQGILPDEVRIGNTGVDFSPVFRYHLSPEVMRDWLTHNPVVHIFERGYVAPHLFLAAIERSTEPEGELMIMLCVEAWLRALASGGAMHRLIPARCTAA